MDYIRRDLQKRLIAEFGGERPAGVILAGIVGCGKTTLVDRVLGDLSKDYDTFKFTGDDISFREAVLADSKFIERSVRSRTQRRALVFVDEAQKSESIFDALKFAFDESKISFIVSGSNPSYLNTQAKRRLQRRAAFITLEPFSLPEIISHKGIIPENLSGHFRDLLFAEGFNKAVEVGDLKLKMDEGIQSVIDQYLSFGGLPLAYLAGDRNGKLAEIQKVVERGFECMSVDNESAADVIRIELARLHSQEFTYQNIFQKTGLRRRDRINQAIDELINHGYLLKKKPILFDDVRRSYLSVFSYIDPGIVTYLTAETADDSTLGRRVEGIVHARLDSIVGNYVPLKAALSYFRPYTVDGNDKVKFKPGEIDFIFTCGRRIVPIEVKAGAQVPRKDTALIADFVRGRKLPFGIVLYNGVPMAEPETKIIYWPFWLV